MKPFLTYADGSPVEPSRYVELVRVFLRFSASMTACARALERGDPGAVERELGDLTAYVSEYGELLYDLVYHPNAATEDHP